MKKLSDKEVAAKQDQIEIEMTLLFKYMDERKMPPDIGLSTLLNALMAITSDLGIPVAPIIEAIRNPQERRASGETVH